jgi:hypothetical protein
VPPGGDEPPRHTEARPDASSAITRPTVTRSSDRGRRKALPVFVSLYGPIGRRRHWWYSYRCPTCGAYQLGRAPALDLVPGVRRAGCGHWITVNVARIYGQPGAAA